MNFDLDSATILRVRHGSHAYGTNVEGSDIDIRGVCIPPEEYYLGFNKRFEQHEAKKPEDTVIFGLQKFCKLAADGNPNILEVLFVDDSDVLYENFWGAQLRSWKHKFLSKRIKRTYVGAARSQMHQLEQRQHSSSAVRTELEQKFGYDTKRAMHTTRWLRMCHEILTGGVVQVKRQDAWQLVNIRNGCWTFAEWKYDTEGMLDAIDDHEELSTLPEHPNIEDIDKRVVELTKSFFTYDQTDRKQVF